LPILTEVVKEDVEEVSDTSEGSDKHVYSLIGVKWKPLFQSFGSFLILP